MGCVIDTFRELRANYKIVSLQLVWYIAHDILRTEMRHLEEQGITEDKKLTDAINQILMCMENNGVNSPLIGEWLTARPSDICGSSADQRHWCVA